MSEHYLKHPVLLDWQIVFPLLAFVLVHYVQTPLHFRVTLQLCFLFLRFYLSTLHLVPRHVVFHLHPVLASLHQSVVDFLVYFVTLLEFGVTLSVTHVTLCAILTLYVILVTLGSHLTGFRWMMNYSHYLDLQSQYIIVYLV